MHYICVDILLLQTDDWLHTHVKSIFIRVIKHLKDALSQLTLVSNVQGVVIHLIISVEPALNSMLVHVLLYHQPPLGWQHCDDPTSWGWRSPCRSCPGATSLWGIHPAAGWREADGLEGNRQTSAPQCGDVGGGSYRSSTSTHAGIHTVSLASSLTPPSLPEKENAIKNG